MNRATLIFSCVIIYICSVCLMRFFSARLLFCSNVFSSAVHFDVMRKRALWLGRKRPVCLTSQHSVLLSWLTAFLGKCARVVKLCANWTHRRRFPTDSRWNRREVLDFDKNVCFVFSCILCVLVLFTCKARFSKECFFFALLTLKKVFLPVNQCVIHCWWTGCLLIQDLVSEYRGYLYSTCEFSFDTRKWMVQWAEYNPQCMLGNWWTEAT